MSYADAVESDDDEIDDLWKNDNGSKLARRKPNRKKQPKAKPQKPTQPPKPPISESDDPLDCLGILLAEDEPTNSVEPAQSEQDAQNPSTTDMEEEAQVLANLFEEVTDNGISEATIVLDANYTIVDMVVSDKWSGQHPKAILLDWYRGWVKANRIQPNYPRLLKFYQRPDLPPFCYGVTNEGTGVKFSDEWDYSMPENEICRSQREAENYVSVSCFVSTRRRLVLRLRWSVELFFN
jgi:hypothetical protein